MNHPLNRSSLAVAVATLGIVGASLAATLAVPAWASPSAVVLAAAPGDASDGRDGAYKSDDEHRKDIKWLLADVSDRAAKDTGFQRVSDWLSSKDRHRIADALGQAKTSDYPRFARAFREAWHEKYGNEFNAHKNMDDITGVRIDFETKDNRKFAKATFPAFGGLDSFEMRLQLEAKNKWRIEVPNDLDAQAYVNALQGGLNNIVKNQASLFKDEKLGLNSAITQMLHGLSFEPGKETASKKK